MLAMKIAFVPFFLLCIFGVLLCLNELGLFRWRKK
jgi:hypothetical protein